MIELTDVFDQIDTAIWIYNIDRRGIDWANKAALAFWDAPSLDILVSRPLADEMSPKVALKLEQYQEDFARRRATFYETWTLYPKGQPQRLRVKCSGFRLPDGTMAMLCEAKDLEPAQPETVRGVEALLHTTVMISMYEGSGSQIYCNPAARASFGGGSLLLTDRFVEPEEASVFLLDLQRMGTTSRTAQVRRTDGIFWHHIVGVSCRDAVTGSQAILLSESDVTDAHEAKIALEASRNDAVRTTRLKSDFLANMSHEIRTPINGVIGMAEALNTMVSDPEHKAILTRILASGEMLLDIINDILDLSKIEAGKLGLENIGFLPLEVAKRIENLHSIKASEKRLDFSVTTDEGAKLTRMGDPHRITQIVNNLVGNAIKFTDKGEVHVSITCKPRMPVIIEVTDTGIGMSKSQQSRIFDDFVQADASTTRRFGGTGLGMSIVKRLVNAMSGKIDLDSEPGVGTTVRVMLPLELGDAKINDTSASSTNRRRFDARVLAADDTETNRTVLDALLRINGVKAEIYPSGEEAVERFREGDFDLLLLDISMPGMDGIQTLKAMRDIEQHEGRRQAPAVAVTANAFPHQIASYIDAGFDEHLVKPLRSDALVNCIHRALEAAKRTDLVS